MMRRKILIELSGENFHLAEGEARALCDIYDASGPELMEEGLLCTHSKPHDIEVFHGRMGLAHNTMELLGEVVLGDTHSLIRQVSEIIEEFVSGKTFWLRIHRLHSGEKRRDMMELSRDIVQMISSGTPRAKNPNVQVEVWIGEKAYVGKRIGEVDRKSFMGRASGERPFFSPISVHPKFARALINLSRVRLGETLYDPFCGTGGILLEAGSMGIRPLGSDIREDMVEGTRENMEHFDVQGETFVHDARDELRDYTVHGIVTDLPYGRSTSLAGSAEDLTQACFDRAEEVLPKGRRLVMGFPSSYDIDKRAGTFLHEEEYDVYVHKSLTRRFHVYRRL